MYLFEPPDFSHLVSIYRQRMHTWWALNVCCSKYRALSIIKCILSADLHCAHIFNMVNVNELFCRNTRKLNKWKSFIPLSTVSINVLLLQININHFNSNSKFIFLLANILRERRKIEVWDCFCSVYKNLPIWIRFLIDQYCVINYLFWWW